MSAKKECTSYQFFDALKASGETAPHRRRPSVPARFLIENNLISGNIFDWGCGYGFDLEYFRRHGLLAEGFNPVHRPDTPPESFRPGSFAWVHCAFVLNTLPDEEDRQKILTAICTLLSPSGHLALSVRSQSDINTNLKPTWRKYSDGYLTSKGTFQRGYLPQELLEIVSPLFNDITVITKNPLFIIAANK